MSQTKFNVNKFNVRFYYAIHCFANEIDINQLMLVNFKLKHIFMQDNGPSHSALADNENLL